MQPIRGFGISLLAILIAPWFVGNVGAIPPKPTTAQHPASPIRIDINGVEVKFANEAPIEFHNAVLVPLRGVFEAMGARVTYDQAAQTITACKGTSVVVVPVGSVDATIDGRLVTLKQPVLLTKGATFVPLRFLAEALGAYVEWRRPQSLVTILTPEAHLSQLPHPLGSDPVRGQLTGIYAGANPEQVTMRINGVENAIVMNDNTTLQRSQPRGMIRSVGLSDIHAGDEVTVVRDKAGRATSITAMSGQFTGTVKCIAAEPNGGHIITFNDGIVVKLLPGAALSMNGRPIEISDIKRNERIMARTDPDNTFSYELFLNPGYGPGAAGVLTGDIPVVVGFHVRATNPIHAGDNVTATFVGNPGGTASMAIPGLCLAVPFVESSPCVYTATFAVPAGISAADVAAAVQLTLDGQNSVVTQSTERLDIASVPPQVTEIVPANETVVENASPLIHAHILDAGGTGIDVRRTQISLDGQDVTARAAMDGNDVAVTPPNALAPGNHQVALNIFDTSGNKTVSMWSFTVSAPNHISSFQTNITPAQILTAGTVIAFAVHAPMHATAHASIAGLTPEIALVEAQPGVYVGSYTVLKGQNTAGAPAVAVVDTAPGTSVVDVLPTSIRVDGGAAPAPSIDSPAEGAKVGQTIAVSGKAIPFSDVELKLEYHSEEASDSPMVSGTAGSYVVAAGPDGTWTVPYLPLYPGVGLLNSPDVHYTISAAAAQSFPTTPTEASTISLIAGRVYTGRRSN